METREAARAALKMHERLRQRHEAHAPVELPERMWDECRDSLRLSNRARLLKHPLAALRLRRQFRGRLINLIDVLDDQRRQLNEEFAGQRLMSPYEIALDLKALEHDFPEVEIDFGSCIISVTTEPVELEGLYLGPFRVKFCWKSLARSQPYIVEALDPHPAACDSDCYHPHVQNGALCEGDARLAIAKAIAEGRLADFFQIVGSVLATYNSASPYVSVEDWDRPECSCGDCGSGIDEEDAWGCEGCSTTICDGCRERCVDCDGIYCAACVTSCDGECGERLCRGCAEDGEGYCKDCRRALEEELAEQAAEEAEANAAESAEASDSVLVREEVPV
ncbi:hypothetical protein [Stratiformator vulcanicus]|uniref:Uncharacterized protein n=1 Tax=Stratiformator vulcanicus TaxID=2527980 RepID=A0A517QZ09_9PLAN|nr:hypothetical protein [Stratiformator vulcanicus]QDT36887.1 hypothetical protein Pan189_12510 [Stratiformator vulcanicus]